jgi:hypothetical protein
LSYDQHILQVLSAVGERGISVSALSKHVYNLNTSFFTQPDLQEVHKYVQNYLLRNSKSPQSLIEHTGRRGYYRLNAGNCADARQLLLRFRAKDEPAAEAQDEPKAQDLSLSLFPD